MSFELIGPRTFFEGTTLRNTISDQDAENAKRKNILRKLSVDTHDNVSETLDRNYLIELFEDIIGLIGWEIIYFIQESGLSSDQDLDNLLTLLAAYKSIVTRLNLPVLRSMTDNLNSIGRLDLKTLGLYLQYTFLRQKIYFQQDIGRQFDEFKEFLEVYDNISEYIPSFLKDAFTKEEVEELAFNLLPLIDRFTFREQQNGPNEQLPYLLPKFLELTTLFQGTFEEKVSQLIEEVSNYCDNSFIHFVLIQLEKHGLLPKPTTRFRHGVSSYSQLYIRLSQSIHSAITGQDPVMDIINKFTQEQIDQHIIDIEESNVESELSGLAQFKREVEVYTAFHETLSSVLNFDEHGYPDEFYLLDEAIKKVYPNEFDYFLIIEN